MVDSSPPLPGSVSVYTMQEQLATTEDIIVQWTDFQDRESGILSYELGIGTHENNQDVYPFQAISGYTAFVDGKGRLSDGKSYFVQVKVGER